MSHAGSNQQLTCVYIPLHKLIKLIKLNEGQHVTVYVSAKYGLKILIV